MNREEAARMVEAVVNPTFGSISKCDNHDAYHEAFMMAIAALRGGGESQAGCWYCADGVMMVGDSPNKPPVRANYCVLCGRKLPEEGV